MNSGISLPKAAESLPETIDIDKGESSIKANTNETKKTADSDSATETEDEWENDKNESDKNENPRDGHELEGQKNHQNMSDQEKANNARDSSDDNTGESNDASAERLRIKLEDVRSVDILLLNKINGSGVMQSKKELYRGFIWYRKVIDSVRSAYMKCKTTEEKLTIVRYLIDKANESGRRFLKEDGDGTTGVCKVMTIKDSVDHTIIAFEDQELWTTIFSFIEGNKQENKPFDISIQAKNVDCLKYSARHQDTKVSTATSLPRFHTSLADSPPPEISSSDQKSVTTAKNAACENSIEVYDSTEQPLKKMKIGAIDNMPIRPSSSSKLDGNSVREALEKSLEEAAGNRPAFVLQGCLSERQMIRRELTQNQEILLIRQERLSRLETEFRLFHDRQMFLPSERWLSEKILRQEEIFENRELLGIQNQRCRRFQTLLELNERQIFEQQTIIEKEKLKMEALKSISRQGMSFEIDVREKLMNEMITGQHIQLNIANAKEATVADINSNTMAMIVAETRKQMTAQRMVDNHLAVEVEMKKRAALEQNAAMEQEIKYRAAMEHAVQRQAAMKQSMEARQLMMVRAALSQHSSETTSQETFKPSNSIQKASPDAMESIGDTDDTKEDIIICGGEDIIIGVDEDIIIGGDEGIIIGGDEDIIIGGDEEIIIGGDEDIIIGCDEEIAMTGRENVLIDVDADSTDEDSIII